LTIYCVSNWNYGLALFAGNVVIASDEGAKQSPNREAGNEKGEMRKNSHILLSIITSHLSPPVIEIVSLQAPRNDKLLNYRLEVRSAKREGER